MKRLLIEDIGPSLDRLTITGREARYINKVSRLKKGQEVIIMDGKGQSFECTIEKVSYQAVTVRIKGRMPPQPPSPIAITLCQALIKSQAMDYAIQKATELGVGAIRLFFSERTVLKIEPARTTAKMNRWKEIMKSACRQCNRADLPSLEPPVPFEEMVESAPKNEMLKILLWENEEKVGLKEILNRTSPRPRIWAVVGPEGGFTPDEIDAARESGFQTLSLGNRILRAETAALSLLSIIQYEWGDLNLSHGQ
ncbi:MAG TPA: 16S rRNA (uracil(1498)-N(3))-methyltransferase [Desulfatiglandales bacterium]|nr:16S rRNA (uracil(1498)-N(3))-methyltransferase [Desulfatiglandales bacterium]